jgi:hypothetical protein
MGRDHPALPIVGRKAIAVAASVKNPETNGFFERLIDANPELATEFRKGVTEIVAHDIT